MREITLISAVIATLISCTDTPPRSNPPTPVPEIPYDLNHPYGHAHSQAEINEAMDRYVDCAATSASALDDHESDARTITAAVANEFYKYYNAGELLIMGVLYTSDALAVKEALDQSQIDHTIPFILRERAGYTRVAPGDRQPK